MTPGRFTSSISLRLARAAVHFSCDGASFTNCRPSNAYRNGTLAGVFADAKHDRC